MRYPFFDRFTLKRPFASLLRSTSIDTPRSSPRHTPLNAKNAALANGVKNHGGDEGARTLDPHVANVVLSQLSYIPINRQDSIFLPSVALVKHKTKRKYKMADG